MAMKFSKFGEKFNANSGINQLMDDLGSAMSGSNDMLMLGGGNPGQVPEVEEYLQQKLSEIANDKQQFRNLIGNYTSPKGEVNFRVALAGLLKRTYGWDLTEENIVLTGGSQNGFFQLFNAIAGEFSDGSHKKILFPVTPEYIGYSDQGLSENMFQAQEASIDLLDNNMFKYRVDFDNLKIDENISALCVSRPTNPTGNVLTDDEVHKLSALAEEHDIPLIIDNAYGVPFPHIIFSDATPIWNENIVLSMSLSKLGLPSTRTGIIIARTEITDLIARTNAVTNLAVSGVGAVLVTDLIESGEILDLSDNYIRPFYQDKMEQAVKWVHTEFKGINYRIHKPEGALFLWLWFPELKISSQELYERLKARGVLAIAGHHFLADGEHKDQCIRVTYSQNADVVSQGIKLIAEEVKSL